MPSPAAPPLPSCPVPKAPSCGGPAIPEDNRGHGALVLTAGVSTDRALRGTRELARSGLCPGLMAAFAHSEPGGGPVPAAGPGPSLYLAASLLRSRPQVPGRCCFQRYRAVMRDPQCSNKLQAVPLNRSPHHSCHAPPHARHLAV